MSIQGKQTVESFHKRLGKIMWDKCGMARNEAGLNRLSRRSSSSAGILERCENTRRHTRI